MTLLDDLRDATRRAQNERDCPLCEAILEVEDEPTQEALAVASAGIIGRERLAAIFTANKVVDPETGRPIGRRTIRTHRAEEHKPL